MKSEKIVVTEKDYLRLESIFKNLDSDEIEGLEIELERAVIVKDKDVPSDVVTMNSRVEFIDMKTEKERIVTIVYPEDANSSEGRISILAPLASALIGLKEEQEIEWEFPSGEIKHLKVLKVHYQPEKSGDWHL